MEKQHSYDNMEDLVEECRRTEKMLEARDSRRERTSRPMKAKFVSSLYIKVTKPAGKSETLGKGKYDEPFLEK